MAVQALQEQVRLQHLRSLWSGVQKAQTLGFLCVW